MDRFGVDGMIWCLMRCNGPLRKHVKSFGMPCMITGGLNGNIRLGIWEKTWTWPIMTFLTNLI